MSPKKIPLRRCVGCQEMKPKRELTRVVLSPENLLSVDVTGRKAGRGAYVCKSIDCLKLARKKKGLDRSLKHEVPEPIWDELEDEFAKLGLK